MAYATGQRLLTALREEGRSSAWMIRESVTDNRSVWHLSGMVWKAEVIVDPQRWIGLTFEVRDPITGRTADFGIDTDLYNIEEDEHRDFARETENEIIDFLDNLKSGKVLRKVGGRDLVLLIPREGAFVRIAKGRFLASRQKACKPDTDGDFISVC